MRYAALGLLVLLLAGPAQGVIDQCPTNMGVYFDLNADTNSYDATANVPFFAYLVLTRSEYPEISGFECNYRMDAGANAGLLFRLAEDLQGGLNTGVTNALSGNYVVGWPAPRTAGSALVLVSWQYMLLGEFPVEIYLEPATIPSLATGTPVLEIGGALAPAGITSGSAESPVATINSYSPVIGVCYPYDPTPAPAVDLYVDITADCAGLTDAGNRAATSPTTTDGYDSGVDTPEPGPPPSNYLTASFYQPAWPLGPRFQKDIRYSFGSSTETKTWPLRVETDLAGDVTLTFAPSFGPEDNVRFRLRDLQTGAYISLFPDTTYTFANVGENVYDFEIEVENIQPLPLSPTSRMVPSGWSLVGLPVQADGATLDSALLDQIGATSYLFGYDPAVGYGMVDGSDPALLGDGHWLATEQAFTWSTSGDRALDGIAVPLFEGWNIVGYPMWFTADKRGIQVRHQGQDYAWEDAVTQGLVVNAVMGYDDINAAYVDVDSLDAWHGYWIAALAEGVDLWFDWPNFEALGYTGLVKSKFADADAWSAPLTLVDPSGAVQSIAFGAHPAATVDFDPAFDAPRPPSSPAGGSRFAFSHPEWDLPCGNLMAADITDPEQTALSWTARMTLDTMGRVILFWDAKQWPAELDFQLYLPGENRVVVPSMREQNNYVFTPKSRTLDLVIRTPDMASGVEDTPVRRYAIGVHPNPFNPMTKISFEMPSAGRAEVRIYSVRGELVATLGADSYQAGRHEVVWRGQDDSGRDVPSGSYFAKLYADGKGVGTVTKMSLVR